MWIFSSVTLLLAALLCSVSLVFSFEYDEEEELRPSYIARRAIDGSRGRKYFNAKEDGFFDDYGFEKGQYHGSKEEIGLSDLRHNVPGEPGVDYPALVKIPRTSFSCIGRERGYYADQESGCQSFHVCDEGLVSSFLCPVGSLFSQRLLTCDWWSKVPCDQSHEFYHLQSHADDVSLTDSDMLRQALTEKTNYHKPPVIEQGKNFVNVRRNENTLDQGHQQKKGFSKNRIHHRHRVHHDNNDAPIIQIKPLNDGDSPIIKIKPVDVDNRQSRIQGHSRSGSSAQGQRSHPSPPQEVSSAEPSVTTSAFVTEKSDVFVTSPKEETFHRRTTAHITEKPHAFSTTSRQDNRGIIPTTLTSYEGSSEQNQENTSANTFTNVPTKKGLEEDNKENSNPPEISNHDSSEYEDMEGKESIGLANSHVERNLEREEGKTTSTDFSDATTLESLGNTTPLNVENVDVTTQQDESFLAKESVGFVHSKIEEKFQLFDNEKKIPKNISEQETHETASPEEVKETVTTPQYFESSTVTTADNYYSSSPSTEESVSYTHLNNEETVATQSVPRTEVRKMSGFKINLTEKRTTDPTTLAGDEISTTNDQESINSSEIPYVTTISTDTTIPDSEQQTTVVLNNVRRISDTVEESNSPFAVTITVNGSSDLSKDESQSPIGADVLGQFISQHEKQPIDLTNLEIIKSDMRNKEFLPNQNQQHISSSPAGVRTYQNIRNYHDQQSNNQQFKNHRPQPTTVSSFDNYQPRQHVLSSASTQAPINNYNNYQNHQNEHNFNNYHTHQEVPQPNHRNYQNTDEPNNLKNFATHNQEVQNSRNQYIPRVTQSPQLNYRNKQNPNIASRGNRRYQTIREDFRNFRTPKIQNSVTTTSRNIITDQVEPQNYENYRNQQDDIINFVSTTVRNLLSNQEEALNIKNYSEEPVISVSTTPKSYVNDYQNPSNFKNNHHEQGQHRDFVSSTVSSYLANEDDPLKFRNYQNTPEQTNVVSTTIRNYIENHDQPLKNTNHQIQPEESINFDSPQNRPFANNNYNNVNNQPVPSKNFNYYQAEQNEPKNLNGFRNQHNNTYHVNYQTHNYPETYVNHQQNEQFKNNNYNTQDNYNNHNRDSQNHQKQHHAQNSQNFFDQQNTRNQQNFNQQNTQNQQNFDQQNTRNQLNFDRQNTQNQLNFNRQNTQNQQNFDRNTEHFQNSQNQQNFNQNTEHFQNSQNQQNFNQNTEHFQNSKNQQNLNYPDYQNYDSAEDLVESTQFGDFGAKISTKNQNSNRKLVPAIEKPKITDAHSINTGLQGKDVNFLYAMSQLAKNDRLPRPFTQDKNLQNHVNNHHNDFTNIRNRNNNNFINSKQVPNEHINFNANHNANHRLNFNEDQPVVEVDDFAAPINKNIHNNRRLNPFLNQKDTGFNKVPSNFDQNNQRNLSEARGERILNHNSVFSTTNAPIEFQFNSHNLNTHNTQNTPEVNAIKLNDNQAFLSTPQPDYNEYDIENTQGPSQSFNNFKHTESQPINYNFQQNAEQPFNNNPQIYSTIQPHSNDFVSHQSTQQTFQNTRQPSNNPQFLSTIQPSSNAFGSHQQTQQVFENSQIHNKNPGNFNNVRPHTTDFVQHNSNPQAFNNAQQHTADFVSHNSNPHVFNNEQQHTADFVPHNSNPHVFNNEQQHTTDFVPHNSNPQVFNNEQHTDFVPNNSSPQLLSSVQPQTADFVPQQPPTQPTFQNTQFSNNHPQIISTEQPHSVDYQDFQPTIQPHTEQSVDSIQISDRNPQVSNSDHSESIDYNFRPTIPPASKNVENNEHKLINFNATKTVSTSKTTVETEFIPSLSFDFGSDQGKKEYLEALEKGLVPSDSNARRADTDVSSEASANVDKVEDTSSSSSSSSSSDSSSSSSNISSSSSSSSNENEKSAVMDNFKNTSDVMSGTE